MGEKRTAYMERIHMHCRNNKNYNVLCEQVSISCTLDQEVTWHHFHMPLTFVDTLDRGVRSIIHAFERVCAFRGECPVLYPPTSIESGKGGRRFRTKYEHQYAYLHCYSINMF